MPLIAVSLQAKSGFGRSFFAWRFLIVLGLWIAPMAWLVPNHYMPWLSAWPDTLAVGGLLVLAIGVVGQSGASLQLPAGLAIACAIALTVIAGQATTGAIPFAGDAWLACFYVTCFALAMACGSAVSPHAHQLAAATAFAACVSVGIALAQWSGVSGLQIYAADLPPGARPFGNLAQPNHLSTAAFLGLCAVGWLRQSRRIGRSAATIGALFLLLGIAMTQSRTGWLQVALLALLLLVRRRQTGIGLVAVGTFLAIFVALVVAWPTLTSSLLLAGGRSMPEQLSSGPRLAHWASLLEAIRTGPLLGHGWLQTGWAQMRVAADRPPVGEAIEHAHNVVLDLLVWNGPVIGSFLSVLLLWWFVRRWVTVRRGPTLWLIAFATGLMVHGLLEYPLEYAYFLVPLGLAIGFVTAEERSGLRIPRAAIATAALGCAVVGTLVARDYFPAEEYHRLLRAESARIGAPGLVTPPPELLVLDQLVAFYRFAHTEATPRLTEAELEGMRRVSRRFGSPPVLFRFALATALLGHREEAERTLTTLCHIHNPARCEEAIEGWQTLSASTYPRLREVSLPTRPGR